MKICDKCGAHNSDNRTFCVDCNETLGRKLSAAEERNVRADMSKKIEELYNKRDPLYVSKFDKRIGWLSVGGAAVSAVLIGVNLVVQQDIKILLCSLIFFAISSVEALIPQLAWELEKLRIHRIAFGANDLEPSPFYFRSRKIAIVVATVFGIVMFLLHCIEG